MSRVLHPSEDDLRAQHEQLLKDARVSREELGNLVDRGKLTADLIWVWENIQSIEFLLGEDDADDE